MSFQPALDTSHRQGITMMITASPAPISAHADTPGMNHCGTPVMPVIGKGRQRAFAIRARRWINGPIDAVICDVRPDGKNQLTLYEWIIAVCLLITIIGLAVTCWYLAKTIAILYRLKGD